MDGWCFYQPLACSSSCILKYIYNIYSRGIMAYINTSRHGKDTQVDCNKRTKQSADRAYKRKWKKKPYHSDCASKHNTALSSRESSSRFPGLYLNGSTSSLPSNRPICLVRADNEPVELTAEVSLTPSLLLKL